MRALSNLLTQLLCLAALLLTLPASAAASEAASLGNYLNPDGTMNLPKDFVGSLNPAGFRMVQEKGGAPRFVAEKSAQAKSGLFGVPFGCNGSVSALARAPSGEIYMGGSFTVCEDVLASRIVSYDPQTRRFRALGSGVANGVNRPVSALAVSGSDLYVGGNFTQAGGVPASSVARWNGSVWTSLGIGNGNGVSGIFAPRVSALAVSGSDLYVGGEFSQAGGVLANNVARWNGSVWASLGAGSDNGVDSFVYALAVSGSNLYVGGFFFHAGGVPVRKVAQWNGSVWSSLGAGIGSEINDFVRVLAVSGSDLYVGGAFGQAGSVSTRNVARWNGNDWSSLGTGSDNGVDSGVQALAVSGSDLYVGGSFGRAGSASARNVARWNGSAWSSLGTGSSNGVDSFVYALTLSGSDLYAGGLFRQAGGAPANGVARWNGSVWSSLGTGSGNGVDDLRALAVLGNDLYVGGRFTQAGGVSANHVARWNGSVWASLGSGIGNNGFGISVNALAVSGSDLYVGGGFFEAGGLPANGVARWNGSVWSSLGTGSRNGVNSTVFALAVSGGDLYVGGLFTQAGGAPANSVAHWNGSSWSNLGSGLDGLSQVNVFALAVSGSDLYAGGQFTQAGGVPANHVARWNGNVWASLGTGSNNGVSSFVTALAVSGSDVFVGGSFNRAGDIPAKLVARWNGSSWASLGTGIDASGISALAVSGSDLYVGGSFTQAGGVPANGLARWNGSTWQGLATDAPPQSVSALLIDSASLYVSGAGITQTPLPRLESANAGTLANAPSASAVVSRTGAKIAFSSTASNLAANESNPLADIFVRTPSSNAITRVSDFARMANGGTQEAYTAPTISADGSVVGFQGSLGQISALDKGNGRLVSRSANGTPGNGPSTNPALSRNGLRLIYQSLASNLTPSDSNSMSDVIMTNLQTGANELISVSPTGQAADGPSFAPWPNEDGSVVAFITLATNLTGVIVPQKAGTVRQALVIIGNSASAKSGLYVSRIPNTNVLGNGDSNNVQITPDGRYGVFESLASNLVADDTNGASDIFRFEIANKQLVRLERFSVSTFGLQGNGPSRNASISDDGRFVTFETDADNLVGLDNNGKTDVLVKAFDTRETIRLSRTIDGVQPNGASEQPSISGDGSTILFISSATNLTPNDNNQAADAFSVEIANPEIDAATASNLTGHWAKASEGGWGLTVSQQGDKLFPNWFTYGTDGKPLWLSMAAGATLQSDGSYAGQIYDFSGKPFNQINNAQAFTSFNIVGQGKISVPSPSKLKFDYTVNGISQSKELDPLVFAEATNCVAAAGSSPATDTNYTDVWNNAVESGWGVHITHQKDVVFGVWYTYSANGRNQWVTAITRSDASGKVFTGPLYRPTSGTPFNLINNAAAATVFPEVGTVRFSFTDGANMQMSYTLDGVTQSKTLSRFQFGTSPTRCSSGS